MSNPSSNHRHGILRLSIGGDVYNDDDDDDDDEGRLSRDVVLIFSINTRLKYLPV